MHESLTQLVEEANKKAADAEGRLKETEAMVKVKDAELAEAKVHSNCWITLYIYRSLTYD